MKRNIFSSIFLVTLLMFVSCATSVHDLETDEYIEVVKTTLASAGNIEECKRRIHSFGFKEKGSEVTNSRGFMEEVITYEKIHKGTEIIISLFSNLEDASFYISVESMKNKK